MARKKAALKQPTSPAQRKRAGNIPGPAQNAIPMSVEGGPGGVQEARMVQDSTIASQVQDLRMAVTNITELLKAGVHHARYEETVSPPSGIVGAPEPVMMQPSGVIQSPAQSPLNRPVPVGIIHQEGDEDLQARLNLCAGCGQRIRTGTVDLKTGEYVSSGQTTKWLRKQPDITVRLAEDNFQKVYRVNGEWLADTLTKRQYGERAISVPGYLCGESTSTHPTVKLVQPVMRRATDDEERKHYASRVIAEAINLQKQGFVQ